MSITGDPEGGPMRVGIPIADLTAGLFCALGILTALVEREKSGRVSGFTPLFCNHRPLCWTSKRPVG